MNKTRKQILSKVMLLIPIITIILLLVIGIFSETITNGSYKYNLFCMITIMYRIRWILIILFIPFILLQLLISIKNYQKMTKISLTIVNICCLMGIYLASVLMPAGSLVTYDEGIAYLGFGLMYSLAILLCGAILLIIGIVMLCKLINLKIKHLKVSLDKDYIKIFLISIIVLFIINTSFAAYYKIKEYQFLETVNSKQPIYEKLKDTFAQAEDLHLNNFNTFATCVSGIECKSDLLKIDSYSLYMPKFKDDITIKLLDKERLVRYSFNDEHYIEVDYQGKIINSNLGISDSQSRELVKKINIKMFDAMKKEVK